MPDLGQPAFSADKHLGHCRDQAEIIPRLIDATAHRHDRTGLDMLDFRPTRGHEYWRPNLWPLRVREVREALTPSLKTTAKHPTIGRDRFMGR